ncbi:hypothetical protein IHV10_13435 [Fictibacillus sp. 5RED26]|uniref:hypothetical protein n=1 Tax=Fictibacillus sp. 5RED26 TaxID=2745876 RepID=UPI0018CC80EC|nr:hypothetical protein [Fictibacillus sp. 5RED26]MBH0157376.1 hypothetical protein [Fictibacillus sp. 5RED26]
MKINTNCVCQTFRCLRTGTILQVLLKGSSEILRISFVRFNGHCLIGLLNGSPILLDCDCICSIGIVPPCVEQTTTFTNTTPIAIPDLSTAIPYPSQINVTGLTGRISKVTATINGFSHTFPEDVGFLLVGPQGQTVELMSCAGGSINAVNAILTFDDSASGQVPTPIVSGTYQPSIFCARTYSSPAPTPPYGTQLSVFNDTLPNGLWSLFVQDYFFVDTGSISGGWTLNITSCEIVTTI